MNKNALSQLQVLSQSTKNSVLITERLLNYLKSMDISKLEVADVKLAIEGACFQLAQMDSIKTRCDKLRTWLKTAYFQSIEEVEKNWNLVEAMSREIFLILKSGIEDFESILKSSEGSKNIQFFYKLSSSLH